MANKYNISQNFREIAQHNLNAAQAFLSTDDDDTLRYAALDLRMAIEALAYELMGLYLDEVDEWAMRKWQPRAVIAELAEIDPHVEISWTVSIGESHEQQEVGTEKRITGTSANKSHNSLGNFLHIPTYEQITTHAPRDLNHVRKKCHEIAAEIEDILKSPISAIKMSLPVAFTCAECKHRVTRQITAMQPGASIRCRGCDAIYDVKEGARVRLRVAHWTCSSDHANATPAHKLAVGAKFSCKTCGEQQGAVRVTMIAPVQKISQVADVNPVRGETKHIGEFIPPTEEKL